MYEMGWEVEILVQNDLLFCLDINPHYLMFNIMAHQWASL